MIQLVPLCLILFGVAHAAEPFDLREIVTSGRTVAAELADFDGDGKQDLLQIIFQGIPPTERRTLRLHPTVAKSLPSYDIPLPPGSAAYDIGDLEPGPGVELILLRQQDLLVLSLRGGKATTRTIAIPGLGSIGPRGEERSMTRMALIHTTPKGTRWLVVQQLGQVVVLENSGRELGRFAVGGVANYYVFESPGLGFAESPVELNYVPARISFARVDTDELEDIVAATRHGVRVFQQRPNGTFDSEPSKHIPLSLVSQADHIRGSGGASAQAQDINGDGLGDLLVSHVQGGISSAGTSATVHLNRGGSWNLAQPDQKFSISDRGSLTLLDLDSDGHPELVQMTTPFSISEIVEALVTQSLDANIAIYRAGQTTPFEKEPWATTKLSLPISFETFAPDGFLPSLDSDMNGDGDLDLITSGSGNRIEIYLGGTDHRYRKRTARQQVGKSGAMTVGDFDEDRRTDLVLFDPHRTDVPVKLLRNRGILPGSPAVLESRSD